MIKDIYTRHEDSPKYDPFRMEVDDELSQIILKIENVLFTRKTEVLGDVNFGANLEDLIFSLVYNELTIQNEINKQIQAYCSSGNTKFSINSQVEFFTTPERNGAIVDIFVNENRVIGVLF